MHWELTRRALRAKYRDQAELQVGIVDQALQDIERINNEAMTRAGLQVEKWTDEKISRLEEELFIGFNITSDEPAEPTSDLLGMELPTAITDPLPSHTAPRTEVGGADETDPTRTDAKHTNPSRRRKAADDWTFEEK